MPLHGPRTHWRGLQLPFNVQGTIQRLDFYAGEEPPRNARFLITTIVSLPFEYLHFQFRYIMSTFPDAHASRGETWLRAVDCPHGRDDTITSLPAISAARLPVAPTFIELRLISRMDSISGAGSPITIRRQSRRYSNCCPLKGGFSQLKKEKTFNRRKPAAIFPTSQPYFVV